MSSMLFCLEGKRKSFLFIISPFLSSVPKIQSIPQFFTRSFAVDFGDHLRSILGITCGRGSLAVLYSSSILILFSGIKSTSKFLTLTSKAVVGCFLPFSKICFSGLHWCSMSIT